MQRHRSYGPRDDAPLNEPSDLAFAGIDMRAPALVGPGYVSSACNKRLREGVYETRRGLFTPAWTRYASASFPYRASYVRDDSATWQADYGTTYGAGIFSDPEGDVWIVRVTARALLFFRETEIGRIIPYLAGLSVAAPVQVVQNYNELILVRGEPLTSLRWSGNWAEEVEELVPASVPGGYAAVPPAHYALAWRERPVLLCDRDDLILGRIGDNTLYPNTVGTDGIFKVNRGRGDVLRAAAPLGAFSLAILKSQSLHVFSAPAADLSDARLDEQPVEIQFDSPRTLVAVDGKVWWLDRRGVRTAEIAAVSGDNKVLLRIDSTVSDKIAPLIRRIAWKNAAQFSATVTTDRIYFAVALDTQTTPQTLLVWSRRNAEWESYDQWNTATLGGFDVIAFAPGVPWLNEPRLFAISSNGRIACLEYGLGEDHVGWSGTVPIRADIVDELVTRGFTAGTNDPKQIKRVQVQVDTWNPVLELEAEFDGPSESLELTGIARDRTRYFTDAADFAPNNADGRFHAAKRQDYSVVLPGPVPASGNPTWQAGGVYLRGDSVFRATNGRNYAALADSVGVLRNVPSDSPTFWQYVRPDDDTGGPAYWDPILNSAGTALTNSAGAELRTSRAPAWRIGESYSAGQSRGYAGGIYTCLVPNVAAEGTQPEDNPALWQDLGEDAGMATSSLLLGAGVRLEDFQTKPERRDINREASWCRIVIRGRRGANRIRGVALEIGPGTRSNVMAA